MAAIGSLSYTLTILDTKDSGLLELIEWSSFSYLLIYNKLFFLDYNIQLTGVIIGLVAVVIQFFLAIMLLLGICTKRQHLMLPYLWLEFINILIYLFAAIMQIFFFWQASIGSFISACMYRKIISEFYCFSFLLFFMENVYERVKRKQNVLLFFFNI